MRDAQDVMPLLSVYLPCFHFAYQAPIERLSNACRTPIKRLSNGFITPTSRLPQVLMEEIPRAAAARRPAETGHPPDDREQPGHRQGTFHTRM